MQEEDFVIQAGWWAIQEAFGYSERLGGGAGAFSGRQHRPKGSPGGGRFKTKAGRLHAVESIKSGFSRPLLADRQKLTGHIHAFIKELNEMEQWWVTLCYSGSVIGRRECREHFYRTYNEQYIAAHCKGAQAGTRTQVRKMIDHRVKQHEGTYHWGMDFYSITSDISRKAWYQTYKPHWDRICDDLARLDRAAQYKIGVKVLHH